MKTFLSILFFIVSLVLFFFVAPEKVSVPSGLYSYTTSTVMNVPTMIEALTSFILGCVFWILAYVDSKFKNFGAKDLEVKDSKSSISTSKAPNYSDTENNAATIWCFIIFFVIIVALCLNF